MATLKELSFYGSLQEPEKDKDGNEIAVVYKLESATRDGSDELKENLEGKTIELVFADGSSWHCDGDSLAEVFPEMDPDLPQNRGKDRGTDDGKIFLPRSLSGGEDERGFLGDIALDVLKVFSKKKVEDYVKDKAEDLVIDTAKGLAEGLAGQGLRYIARGLENSSLFNGFPEEEDETLWTQKMRVIIKDEGGVLAKVTPDFSFEPFNPTRQNDKDFLLLIHGTNSDTLSAFEGLKWVDPKKKEKKPLDTHTWKSIHKKYEGRVLAFQHRSLTQSPLENAKLLVSKLPKKARIHIISHSRGGLIGDILSRYHQENSTGGFTKTEKKLLEKVGRVDDLAAIEALDEEYLDNEGKVIREITVEKFVRVACPAAGTTLLSRRLDTYLNVLGNVIGGGPVSTGIKELLKYAVSFKANTDVLPGLEAMMPESPFQKVLNHPSEESKVSGQILAVISGNAELSVSFGALWTILGKLFYRHRNDWIVDTRSMYLGAQREEEIFYFFDEGGHVNHFSFFNNESSNKVIEHVIQAEANATSIPGFERVLQIEVPAEARGIEKGELRDDGKVSGERPIVVLLPGIMGSNLYAKENKKLNRLWLNYGKILSGNLTDLSMDGEHQVVADSVVRTSYKKLYDHLSKSYDVVIFPFDWRKSLFDSTARLNTKIKELLKVGPPIKIIGHSMGGVLVRDFILKHRQTWNVLNERDGFQLIFLGSPLRGSHRILTVMFGMDDIIRMLDRYDIFNSKSELVSMFKKFPGILGLLPLDNDVDDYSKIKTWEKLRNVFKDPDWPLPDDDDLKIFEDYQKEVLNKTGELTADDYANMAYIAGKDELTPKGYYLDKTEPKKLYFIYTGKGDQSVTWELGIPKEIDKRSVYYTRTTHAQLANDETLFAGIDEILIKGDTSLLSNKQPFTRSEEEIIMTEPAFDFDYSEKGLDNALFGRVSSPSFSKGRLPITVSVTRGHLKYAKYPLLAGHFKGDGILYAEKAINNCLNNELREFHSLGIYPGEIETYKVFIDKKKYGEFAGSIILGIGEQGKLTAHTLSKTVEKGVLNYLVSVGKTAKKDDRIGISSLVMASGFGGLSIEASLSGIVTGINNANIRIRETVRSDHPTIEELEIIELYADRALNCFYTINQMIERDNSSLNLILGGDKKIHTSLGHRNRIPLSDPSDWWNRISISYKEGRYCKDDESEILEPDRFIFNVATDQSREEQGELYNGINSLDTFIDKISRQNRWDECDAKALFGMLIPNQFKEKLKRKGNISLIVDGFTASYPWELLQDASLGAKPLCINAGMIRQMSTDNYRTHIQRANNNHAYVVADPTIKVKGLSQLPGAREEGNRVAELLNGANYQVTKKIRSDEYEIKRNLHCGSYSIIHLAGHGIYNAKFPDKSGMVIGEDEYLTIYDIKQLDVVPDLVFVNCCHLGFADSKDEKFYKERYRLAANIGTQLIQIGVKAVIAAGWAVNDAAALEFAETFYEEMFNGSEFGKAVKFARSRVFDNYKNVTNTWGAYQCYGDPFFTLRVHEGKKWEPKYLMPEEVEVHLENLLNNMQIGTGDPNKFESDLNTIYNAAIDGVGKDLPPRIREYVASIYQDLGDYKNACKHYEVLLQSENAKYSMKAMEKYCNIRIKHYTNNHLTGLVKRKPVKDTKENILKVIEELTLLNRVGTTSERYSLLGSAYKRLSMVSQNRDDITENLLKSQEHYLAAHFHEKNETKYYSLTNIIEIACLLSYLDGSSPLKGLKVDHKQIDLADSDSALKLLEEQKEVLNNKISSQASKYWDMGALVSIQLTTILVNEGGSEKEWKKLSKEFGVLWEQVGSPSQKIGELEQLQFLILTLHRAKHRSTKKYRNTEKYRNLIDQTSQMPEDLQKNLGLLRAAIDALPKKK